MATPATKPLSELGQRLLPYKSAKESFYVAVPDAEKPFADYSDFCQRGIKKEEKAIRIYGLQGHEVQLVIPETYAAILDDIRSLRLQAENGDREAESKLAGHEFGLRALPEDFLEALDASPDSRFFKRLLVLNESNVEDIWIRQTYSETYVSSAAVEQNGDILFFRRDRDNYILTDLMHEWSHGLRDRMGANATVFDDAVLLEGNLWIPSNYALRSFAEHFAVLGEHLLSPDALRFANAVAQAPARCAVIALACKEFLEAADLPRRSSYHSELTCRVKHILQQCLPAARALTEKNLENQDPGIKAQAERLSAYLFATKEGVAA